MEEKITAIDSTMSSIWRNIERLETGGINCVEWGFPRSRKYFPGHERAQYISVMAQTKNGKTQFASEEFIYKPIMQMYYGSKRYDYTVLYVPAEETRERVIQRFMAWLLYEESDGKVNVSPAEIRSTDKPCPKEALDMLQDEHIREILDFFNDHVIFYDEIPNPTGVRNWAISYAENHGTTHRRKIEVDDEFGTKVTKEVFDYYEPNNPDAFTVLFIDPINRLAQERGMDERQNIKKMSEYCLSLRNDYGFTPIIIQQANFTSFSVDAAKIKKFEPTVGDSGGSKEITQDLDVQFALYCPANYDVDSYYGYDINKLRKRGLFARITINRNAEAGAIIPMFFDGKTSHFWELPRPKDIKGMTPVYSYCEQMSLPHTSEELAALNPFIKRTVYTEPKVKQGVIDSFINLLFSK